MTGETENAAAAACAMGRTGKLQADARPFRNGRSKPHCIIAVDARCN